MPSDRQLLKEKSIRKKILKNVFGFSLIMAGISVLVISGIKGYIGFKDGLYNFSEDEYLASVADIENDFLPLIAPNKLEENVIGEQLTDVFQNTPEINKPEFDTNSGGDRVNEIVEQTPIQIQIPSIDLDAEVVSSEQTEILIDGLLYSTWTAPKGAVGWQFTSAKLGQMGNTVLIGHNNTYGSIFKNLKDLESGDRIIIFSDEGEFAYEVVNILILLEKDQSLDVRVENGKWLWPTIDERVTLVTCWPKYDNSHRLIIVAMPVGN